MPDLEGETQHFVAFMLIFVANSIYYAMCMHREPLRVLGAIC